MKDLKLELKIKKLAKQRGISIRQLCKSIEMTESGFTLTLKNDTIKVSLLQKIAEVLSVDIKSFFDPEIVSEKIKYEYFFTSTIRKP